MKCLSIQIQPEARNLSFVEQVIRLSRELGRYPEVDRANDEGIYVNLNYFTENLPLLWSELSDGLMNNDQCGEWLRSSSIVVCEGESGWDDYLLLHHFDKGETLDQL